MSTSEDDATSPTGRHREVTRERLMAAAAAVFDKVGTIAVSVRTICARAGFTRGAFYSNFASVEELFLAVYVARAANLKVSSERRWRVPRVGRSSRGSIGCSLRCRAIGTGTRCEPSC